MSGPAGALPAHVYPGGIWPNPSESPVQPPRKKKASILKKKQCGTTMDSKVFESIWDTVFTGSLSKHVFSQR